jgi:hypothetical protein
MKKYLAIVFLVSLLVIITAGAVNYAVDPLLLYRYEPTNTDKLNRIDLFLQGRVYKPGHISRLKPEAIIMGSSRSAGIRPAHPDWDGLSSYNGSVPGLRIYEMLRFVEHAHANRPLKKLMLGIDFNSMVVPEPLFRPGFVEARMATSAGDFSSISYRIQRLKDFHTTLFSLDMLDLSTAALRMRNPGIRRFNADGSWESTSKSKLVGPPGYTFVINNAIDRNRERELSASANIAKLGELLRFCHRNSIETKIFFTPTHVYLVDVWQQLSSRNLWRQVHRDIVKVNETIAIEDGRAPFEIWGFGNIDGISNEPIYSRQDINKAWFNDGVHFRARLAENIMNAMWAEDRHFGSTLSVTTINGYLDDIESMRDSFMEKNSGTVYELLNKKQVRSTLR